MKRRVKRKHEDESLDVSSKHIKLEKVDVKPFKTEPLELPFEDSSFKKELQLMKSLLDFHPHTYFKSNEAIKKEILSDILSYTSGAEATYSKAASVEVVKAVSLHISNEHVKKEGRDPSVAEEIWLEMKSIYQILLNFLETIQLRPKEAKEIVGRDFAKQITQLIPKAIDPERALVLKVLRQLYIKFVHLRRVIREEYTLLLKDTLEAGEAPVWLSSLLEFIICIVKGFAAPLKKEHKLFFQHILVPLHKLRNLASFHAPLVSCTTWFLKKEPELLIPILDALAALWLGPDTPPDLQMILLKEIRSISILVKDDTPDFENVVRKISGILTNCFENCRSEDVLETALYFWSKSGPEQLFREKVQIVMPIVFTSLRRLTKFHGKEIVGLAYNVLKIFMETDPELFKKLRKGKLGKDS